MAKHSVQQGYKQVSLVMLAFNEVDILEDTVKKYHAAIISKLPGSEFIIAEDGSTDGTKELLRKLEKKYPLRVVCGNERKGYTKAMVDGLKLATKDIIFFSDSDGQHDPNDFWKMYRLIDKYDIISGRKSHRKDGTTRFVVSYGMNWVLTILFGKRLRDANSGFKLMRKSVVERITKEDFTMRLASAELMAKAIAHGFRIKEIDVKHFERKFGKSRGIPNKKIPGFITETLRSLIRIRMKRKQ